MSIKKNVHRIFLLSILFNIAACSSWRALDKHNLRNETRDKPRLQIVLRNGNVLEIQTYRVKSDSLIIVQSATPFFEGTKTAIPFSEIEKVKIQNLDCKETIVSGVVAGAGFYLFFRAINAYGKGFSGLR